MQDVFQNSHDERCSQNVNHDETYEYTKLEQRSYRAHYERRTIRRKNLTNIHERLEFNNEVE